MPAILGFIEKIFKPAADLIDEVVTSKEEKMKLSNELFKMKQELSMQMWNYEQKLLEKRSSVIGHEVQGNWLQRSWRPILMLAFGFIIVYQYFIGPVFALDPINLPEGFWHLLQLGIGGYVIGRSVEKVTPGISEAIQSKPKRMPNSSFEYPYSQQYPHSITNLMPPSNTMQPTFQQSSSNLLPVTKENTEVPNIQLSNSESRRLARRRRGEERRRRRAQKAVK